VGKTPASIGGLHHLHNLYNHNSTCSRSCHIAGCLPPPPRHLHLVVKALLSVAADRTSLRHHTPQLVASLTAAANCAPMVHLSTCTPSPTNYSKPFPPRQATVHCRSVALVAVPLPVSYPSIPSPSPRPLNHRRQPPPLSRQARFALVASVFMRAQPSRHIPDGRVPLNKTIRDKAWMPTLSHVMRMDCTSAEDLLPPPPSPLPPPLPQQPFPKAVSQKLRPCAHVKSIVMRA
jgi:hypothetical protein